jgi:hypothetical protein
MLAQADELNVHNICDCFLSCSSLFLLPLCVPTFYSKVLVLLLFSLSFLMVVVWHLGYMLDAKENTGIHSKAK